jgi:hypothetical protein
MRVTQIFIVVSFLVIVLFDVAIIALHGAQESISAYILRWSHEHPSIPFVAGFICGHLFWSMKDKNWKRELK